MPSDIKSGEVGPNGYPLGYTKNGDKAEWLPDEDEPGKSLPAIIRRSDDAIGEELVRCWDAVWWNRHQDWLHRIRSGEEKVEPERAEIFIQARTAAREVEERLGMEALTCADDFELGVLNGRLSALRWVMGWDWEGSMDT